MTYCHCCGHGLGLSAQAIRGRSLGAAHGPFHHPYDAGDFKRCVDYLANVDVDITIMRGASPQWDALVDNWRELTQLLAAELVNNRGRAPQTSARIRQILNEVRK